MKDFKLNTESPWLPQLKRLEYELIQDAIRLSKGNKAEASRLLGMSESTLKKRIRANGTLKRVTEESRPKRIELKNNINSILPYFLLGLSIEEISKETRCRKDKVREMLSNRLGVNNCNVILNTNEQMRSEDMNTEEIIENNRQLLATIAESIRENKELSPENLVYAKILFSNGFITEKGEVTEEGREALYH